MATPHIPDSLLGVNVADIVNRIHTGSIPEFVTSAIRRTVAIIADEDDDRINPGDPQPEGQRPIPTTDPGELSALVQAIDAALAGIGLVLRVRFLIPAQYEKPLDLLAAALRTIRGWLV